MSSTKPWPVSVIPLGPVAVGTMGFRSAGELKVAIVVKAAFGFVPHGKMMFAAPEGLLRADAHYEDNPARSVRASSDRIPFRPKADVLFLGSAYAPGGAPARKLTVRLAIMRGEEVILNKAIDVVGDRVPSQARPTPEPAPFIRMPIVYERAVGGRGLATNPVGMGSWPSSAPQGALPNIIYSDPWQAGGEPAALGPISPRWPARQRLLNGAPLDLLDA